ncbi:hypothetical protein IMSAGC008_02365 [Muribaculaceae bacterium]|nr:hypothetical protein IMSAGC008_02365 [Muribaculaceae bacterium]
MLRHGLHASVLEAEGVCHRGIGHALRVFTKRAIAYYRIGRIGVYIGIGREVGVNAHQFAFASHFLPVAVKQLVVADGAEAHVVWETRSLFYPHRKTPLAVEGHKHRHFGLGLRPVGHLGKIADGTLGEQQAAYTVGFNLARYRRFRFLTLGRHYFGEHKLCHALPFGERGVYRVGPVRGLGNSVFRKIRHGCLSREPAGESEHDGRSRVVKIIMHC